MPGAGSQKPPVGPNGEKLCRWCRKEVQPPKRTFCGPECVHEWRLRSSTSYLRQCVRERDKEICAACGLDCKALRIELRKLKKTDPAAWLAKCEEYSIPKHRRNKSLFDAEHVIPVCEGGGESGLQNLISLCLPCHRISTNALLARRREQRKLKPKSKKKRK